MAGLGTCFAGEEVRQDYEEDDALHPSWHRISSTIRWHHLLEPGRLPGHNRVTTTRWDLSAATTQLQTKQTAPTIGDFKQLKSVLERAKKNRERAGLYYRKMIGPFRLARINDAAHATKTTSYAHEAQGLFLMEDRRVEFNRHGIVSKTSYDNVFGAAHPLI
eukprot:5868501-Pyramimonas_sp.AAC.1